MVDRVSMDLVRLIGIEINWEAMSCWRDELCADGHPQARSWRLHPKAMCFPATSMATKIYPHFFDDLQVTPMALEVELDIEGELSHPDRRMVEREHRRQEALRRLPPSRSGWRSHLVPLLDGTIVDSTAAQYAKPYRGAYLPDTVIIPESAMPEDKVNDWTEFRVNDWTEFRYTTSFGGRDEVTAVLKYRQQPDNTIFYSQRVWALGLEDRFAEAVIGRVEAAWTDRRERAALRDWRPRPGADWSVGPGRSRLRRSTPRKPRRDP